MKSLDDIINMLVFVARERTFMDNAEAWDYGWCDEDYRRSKEAAIQHSSNRTTKLTTNGVRAYENAVHLLLRKSEIAARWDEEEFWGVVASLVGRLPEGNDTEFLRKQISERITLLFSPGAIVAFPIANLQWKRAPLLIADIVIGTPDDNWLKLITSAANGRPDMHREERLWWLVKEPEDGTVAAAVWVPSLGTRAANDAAHRLDQLVELTLLLVPDLDAREIWSGRGALHRPGVRGLVVDRRQLFGRSDVLPREISRELSASLFVRSALGTSLPIHWYSDDPFPLDELLDDQARRDAVLQAMTSSSEVFQRLRLAARWHAKAHWSLDSEDAVLSIGIAFDALLGEEQGPQRREIAERFALLEPSPAKREEAFRTFAELYYTARSEVAHGQPCSALKRPFFEREMSAALRNKVAAVYQLIMEKKIKNEADYGAIFKALKWGTVGR